MYILYSINIIVWTYLLILCIKSFAWHKEIKQVGVHCESEEWNGEPCNTIKNNITNVCMQNDPWEEMAIGEENNKFILDCPKMKKLFK